MAERTPIMPDQVEVEELAELYKVFGDATRLRILFVLSEQEMSVGELAERVEMTQSAVSHQLKILKQNKLIRNRRDGKQIYYSLADDHVRLIIDMGLEHVNE